MFPVKDRHPQCTMRSKLSWSGAIIQVFGESDRFGWCIWDNRRHSRDSGDTRNDYYFSPEYRPKKTSRSLSRGILAIFRGVSGDIWQPSGNHLSTRAHLWYSMPYRNPLVRCPNPVRCMSDAPDACLNISRIFWFRDHSCVKFIQIAAEAWQMHSWRSAIVRQTYARSTRCVPVHYPNNLTRDRTYSRVTPNAWPNYSNSDRSLPNAFLRIGRCQPDLSYIKPGVWQNDDTAGVYKGRWSKARALISHSTSLLKYNNVPLLCR